MERFILCIFIIGAGLFFIFIKVKLLRLVLINELRFEILFFTNYKYFSCDALRNDKNYKLLMFKQSNLKKIRLGKLQLTNAVVIEI